MSNILLINATSQESRVCVLEKGQIQDYYLERRHDRGQVGNIYVGRVLRVVPGMQAAFVDIGLEKAAFLHASDVFNHHKPILEENDEVVNETRNRQSHKPIETLLKNNQKILVQVIKDPINSKGARITGHISLAGRYLVFMPTEDHHGISRQITDNKERKRLHALVNEMCPKGSGFIVRTASQGVPSEFLRQDMKVLLSLWNGVVSRKDQVKAPKRLHKDLDLVLRAARDLATVDLDYLILDSKREYDRVLKFIKEVMPGFDAKVQLYIGAEPIFDAYAIEQELEDALEPKVNLPSGGHLVIERTEALTAIDVNTGKFVGKKLEDTIKQTNIEAAYALAYQLRLRNIGGLIIIDFIDMDRFADRKDVEKALQKALTGDRGNVKFTRISAFGLVEMTRKRTKESLPQMIGHSCPTCHGLGWVKTKETVTYELVRELKRRLLYFKTFEIGVRAHSSVIQLLLGQEKKTIRTLENRFHKKIHFKSDPDMFAESYEIEEILR